MGTISQTSRKVRLRRAFDRTLGIEQRPAAAISTKLPR